MQKQIWLGVLTGVIMLSVSVLTVAAQAPGKCPTDSNLEWCGLRVITTIKTTGEDPEREYEMVWKLKNDDTIYTGEVKSKRGKKVPDASHPITDAHVAGQPSAGTGSPGCAYYFIGGVWYYVCN